MRMNRILIEIPLFAFIFILLFFVEAASQQSSQIPQAKGMEITLPIIGTKIPIADEYQKPLLIAGILFVLLYYLPKGYVSMRESLSKLRAHKATLELERMRYELLKTKYEIEALKKEHKLGNITLSERVETTIREAVKPDTAISDRKERKKEIILRQVQDVGKRKRFIIRRLIAFLIDNILYVVAFSFLLILIDDYLDMRLAEETIGFLSLAAFALYFVVMWATRDATIGKLIVGLRIVTIEGKPLSIKDAFIRFIIWMPLTVLAFSWVFWDKQKQALYDKAAKTVVVTVRKKRKREL